MRGDSSAACYWRKPEKSRETMRGDWIDTGDRFVERDGYYYFRGRTDELVKISGQWVWPLEVERCLNEHPHVHECAVLAHELPGRRMTLRAVVRLGDSVEESDATRTLLQQFVKNPPAALQVPAASWSSWPTCRRRVPERLIGRRCDNPNQDRIDDAPRG